MPLRYLHVMMFLLSMKFHSLKQAREKEISCKKSKEEAELRRGNRKRLKTSTKQQILFLLLFLYLTLLLRAIIVCEWLFFLLSFSPFTLFFSQHHDVLTVVMAIGGIQWSLLNFNAMKSLFSITSHFIMNARGMKWETTLIEIECAIKSESFCVL